jgi:glycosyltransferase involved in cell wall biosynthesis
VGYIILSAWNADPHFSTVPNGRNRFAFCLENCARGDPMTRFSIVTISFNQGQFLERALRSVLDQDYEDIEYIVVDPGSTDGSRDIIERYRSRISKFIFEPDNGPANGLNKGFAAATGNIFGYINADDAYLPGAIGKAAAAFRSRRNTDVIYGHSYIVNGDGKIIRRSRSASFNLRLYAYGGVTVMQQSTFFSRSAFEKAGGFNESNRSSWDGELLVDLALCGCQFSMIEDYWSLFAVYPGTITSAVKHNRRFQDDQARMFRAITGRDYDRANKLKFRLARIEKWLRDPRVLIHRIEDKIGGASRFSAALPLL